MSKDTNMTRAVGDWVHSVLMPGNGLWRPLEEEVMTENSQQGAEVRSRGNEEEVKWVSVKGRHVWRNVIFCSFILHHQTHISHPAGLEAHHSQTHSPPSLIPASSLPLIPPESCRQAFILILIKASVTAFHPQPCRLLSPSGEAVKLFIIAILSEIGRRTWLQGVEVELGEDFGWQTCWVWQQIIGASLQGLISASIGQPMSPLKPQ